MTESTEEDAGRTIPEPTKREVRIRCGFGCVLCGKPIYEYDHMIDWAKTKHHKAEEITLLCDQHHREKTSGLLPIEAVRAANADPYNRRMGESSPYTLHYGAPGCQVVAGGLHLSTSTGADLFAFVLDGHPMLGFHFEDDRYMLNAHLYDRNNDPLLRVVNNELVYSASQWDIEFVGRRLIFRTAHRKILLDIEFDPPARIVIHRGYISRNGIELFVRSDMLLGVNFPLSMKDVYVTDMQIAFLMGQNPQDLPAAFNLGDVPRTAVERSAVMARARSEFGEAHVNELLATTGVDYDEETPD